MPATRNGVEFVADRYLLTLLCLLLLAGCMGDRAAVRSTSDTLGSGLRAPRPDDAAHVRLRQSFDRLPMSFEANEGQTDEQVDSSRPREPLSRLSHTDGGRFQLDESRPTRQPRGCP